MATLGLVTQPCSLRLQSFMINSHVIRPGAKQVVFQKEGLLFLQIEGEMTALYHRNK